MTEHIADQAPADLGLIETGVNLLFIVGIICVYQSSSDALYKVGLALLALGTVGTLALLLIKRSHGLTILERITLVGMLLGVLGMFQSWNIWLYENGFYLLGIATLSFIIVSHIPTSEKD